MRKSIKAVFAVGSAALIISASAMAQEAVPSLGNLTFGKMGATAGGEDTCATIIGAGAKCSVLVTGSGFIQRQIEYNGEVFIQTVIEENKGTGANRVGFNSEDFVRIQFGGTTAGGIQGVASKLTLDQGDVDVNATTKYRTVSEAAGKAGFIADSLVFTGWANEGAPNVSDSKAVLRVDISDFRAPLVGGNTDFLSKFYIDTKFDSENNVNIVNNMVADQTVNLGVIGDKQRFYTAIKPAVVSTPLTGTPPAPGPFKLGALSPTAVTFGVGDSIQVVWVGQEIAGLGKFGAGVLTANPNAPTSSTSIFSLADVGPFNWESDTATTNDVLFENFGAKPTF